MKYFIQSAVIALFVFAAVLALAIVFGAPKDPPPMKRITQPFKEIRVYKEKEQFVARWKSLNLSKVSCQPRAGKRKRCAPARFGCK